MKYRNGRLYEGEWKKDLRWGRGFEKFHNANSFCGTYEKGKAHGRGVYTWATGEIYDGEWKKGFKDGSGMWKGINGDSYIGEWVKNKAEGYGVHVWRNGKTMPLNF
jgi:hypothetical protein